MSAQPAMLTFFVLRLARGLVVSWWDRGRHNGKMNKLLSLLLLALAVVSTQGFAVSSGIPVMGGAVGGTWLFS